MANRALYCVVVSRDSVNIAVLLVYFLLGFGIVDRYDINVATVLGGATVLGVKAVLGIISTVVLGFCVSNSTLIL